MHFLEVTINLLIFLLSNLGLAVCKAAEISLTFQMSNIGEQGVEYKYLICHFLSRNKVIYNVCPKLFIHSFY